MVVSSIDLNFRRAAALTVAATAQVISSFYYQVTFLPKMGLPEQAAFTKEYLAVLGRHERVAFLFDTRQISNVDPRAVLEHIKVFGGLKEVHRQKMVAFGLVMTSPYLRTFMDWIFRVVPPSSPCAIVKSIDEVHRHVVSHV
jgi:hypothetical protein